MGLWEDILGFFYHLFGYRQVTASSVLKSVGGTPIQNGTVVLSYEKAGGSWTQDGSGLTSSSGAASESVYLKSGTYNFRVAFAGGGGYKPSTAEKDGVKV